MTWDLKDIAAVIQACATLLWPIFAFVALLVFRPQLQQLLGRLRKGKFLGQEVELDQSLDTLNQSAIAAAKDVAKLPQPSVIEKDAREEADTDTNIVRTILDEA